MPGAEPSIADRSKLTAFAGDGVKIRAKLAEGFSVDLSPLAGGRWQLHGRIIDAERLNNLIVRPLVKRGEQ